MLFAFRITVSGIPSCPYTGGILMHLTINAVGAAAADSDSGNLKFRDREHFLLWCSGRQVCIYVWQKSSSCGGHHDINTTCWYPRLRSMTFGSFWPFRAILAIFAIFLPSFTLMLRPSSLHLCMRRTSWHKHNLMMKPKTASYEILFFFTFGNFWYFLGLFGDFWRF